MGPKSSARPSSNTGVNRSQPLTEIDVESEFYSLEPEFHALIAQWLPTVDKISLTSTCGKLYLSRYAEGVINSISVSTNHDRFNENTMPYLPWVGETKKPHIEVLTLDFSTSRDVEKVIERLHTFPALKTLSLHFTNNMASKEVFNIITHIFKEVDLRRLTALEIDSAQLQTLPVQLVMLSELELLNLQNCLALTTLPEGIERLTKLLTVNLSRCQSFTAKTSALIPSQLPFLQTLILSHWQFTVLPAWIPWLTKLQQLTLNYCGQLTSLNELTKVKALTSLELEGCNSLSNNAIPSQITLHKLNLSHCGFNELPDWIYQLPSLKILDLSYSPNLVELPLALTDQWDLEELNLSNCPALQTSDLLIFNSLKRLVLEDCRHPTAHLDYIKLPSLQVLNAARWQLQNLPPDINELVDLQILNLSNSSVTSLPAEVGRLLHLQILDLSGCSSLTSLPAELSNLTQLRILDLSGCRALTALPSGLERLTQLQILNLTGCSSLKSIAGALKEPLNLNLNIEVTLPSSTLSLDFKNLQSLRRLPNWICSSIHLKILDLRACRSLIQIPSWISWLQQLEELNLADCSQLNELPSEIGQLTSLKILRLNNCTALAKLPAEIGRLYNLQELHLSGCKGLTELPMELKGLIQLKKLDLSNCTQLQVLPSGAVDEYCPASFNLNDTAELPQLPPVLGQLRSLQILNMSGCCQFTDFPLGMGQFSQLRTLNLSNWTSLTTLPDEIEHMKNLQELVLAESGLESLPETVTELENLTILKLDNCSAFDIFSVSAQLNTFLQKLDCSGLNLSNT